MFGSDINECDWPMASVKHGDGRWCEASVVEEVCLLTVVVLLLTAAGRMSDDPQQLTAVFITTS